MNPMTFGAAVVDSLTDSNLFASAFQPADSWRVWLIALRLLFGLPLSAAEWRIASTCTGRTQVFAAPPAEAWFLCGRRSGKSRILALLAVCAACFRDYSQYLAPGERALVMVLAKDRDQAQVIFAYARALIAETPMLAALIEHETAETLELTNGVVIAVHTNSYKSVRGRTLVAALGDEIAFWEADDSRNPAEAVIRALRPSLATIPGGFLLFASSTYTADGVLFDAYSKHFGKDSSPVLVWKADTLTMNPSFRREVVDAAYAADSKDAAAEYGSEWLVDVRQHFPEADINAAIMVDRQAIARDVTAEYVGFCDPSGGAQDSMTLAVAHLDASRICVLDRLEVVKPPFKPEDVCQRFADILSAYGLTDVTGDRYGSEFTVSAFRRVGINYRASELTKSEIYIGAQPLFTQRRIELLDIPLLAGQLRRLERRARAGGRDLVDHPRGAHDDAANSACGALVLASKHIGVPSYGTLNAGRQLHVGGSDYNPWDRGVPLHSTEENSRGRRH
jgi:hypothetical protein